MIIKLSASSCPAIESKTISGLRGGSTTKIEKLAREYSKEHSCHVDVYEIDGRVDETGELQNRETLIAVFHRTSLLDQTSRIHGYMEWR